MRLAHDGLIQLRYRTLELARFGLQSFLNTVFANMDELLPVLLDFRHTDYQQNCLYNDKSAWESLFVTYALREK